MRKMNGEQLYGLKKIPVLLKLGRHKELKGLSLKQKLGLNYVSKESKLTKLDGKIYSNTFTPYYPSSAYDRFLKGVITTALGKPAPVITNFAVTSRCPCQCWHCSFSKREKEDELSLKELQKAIADVQDMGVSVIGITGGEPLLRDDLEDIIASIDERSMPLLFTTGYNLTIERVRALKKAGLKIPVLSLDHYTAEIHDRGRGRKGVFEWTLKAVGMFQSEGFYVAVSFVPGRKLVDDRKELFKTIEFFRDLGINDMRLTSPILSGKLTGRAEEKLTEENVKTIFEVQKFCTRTKGYPGVFAYDYFESEKFYGCGAGYNYMFIDSTGNVSPCDFTMLTLGNIKEKAVKEIWDEMSGHFCGPSCTCYANKIHDLVDREKLTAWPIPKGISEKILSERPPFNLSSGQFLEACFVSKNNRS